MAEFGIFKLCGSLLRNHRKPEALAARRLTGQRLLTTREVDQIRARGWNRMRTRLRLR